MLSSKDIWMCTVCFTCQERCPTRVEVTDLMLALRNLATKEGYAPAPLKNVLKALFETGHEFPFTGYTRKLRRELGLSETPPLTISSSKALEEVQKLMKMVGIVRPLESGEVKK